MFFSLTSSAISERKKQSFPLRKYKTRTEMIQQALKLLKNVENRKALRVRLRWSTQLISVASSPYYIYIYTYIPSGYD
jgi:uncharacterized membrane-anchored protein